MSNSRTWRRIGLVVAAAVAGVLGVSSSAHAVQLLPPNLVCTGDVTYNFSPGLTLDNVQQSITTTNGLLDNCFSPSGNNPSIITGDVVATPYTTPMDCTTSHRHNNQFKFTWRDANNAVLGNSTVNAASYVKGDTADSEAANWEIGPVSAGSRFLLQTYIGTFTADLDTMVGDCLFTPITQVTGKVTMMMSAL